MRAVDRSEISAYLDGELDDARAREVEAALAADSALTAEFAALDAADKNWREAARAAQFEPSVRLPAAATFLPSLPGLAAVMIALLALRFLPGLVGSSVWAFAIHGVALAVLSGWTVRAVAAFPAEDEQARAL
jgi:anti-sigma factor RsiW